MLLWSAIANRQANYVMDMPSVEYRLFTVYEVSDIREKIYGITGTEQHHFLCRFGAAALGCAETVEARLQPE